MVATLVTLTGRFANPDESPALAGGRITFELVPGNVPDTSIPETIVPGPVSVPVLAGAFTVHLRATDDPELTANVDGPLVYRVTRTGIREVVTISLPAPGPWDWTDLSPTVEPSDTVVVPVPGPPGPPGPPGVAGGATTVAVFTYTDEADTRPDSDVVFWIPDPFDLPNPIGAVVGDLVLRSTPDVVTGLNGVTGLWQGTTTEYDAIETPDSSVVYFVIAP
jgi:hypothetical protein